VLVVSGVALALLATDTASHCACFDRRADEEEIGHRLASHDPACRLTGLGTVEVQPDGADELLDVFLAETGIGATDASGGTLEAAFDATKDDFRIEVAR
jgi:hypothetical protein